MKSMPQHFFIKPMFHDNFMNPKLSCRAVWYNFTLFYSLKQLNANIPPAINFKSFLPVIDVFFPNQYDRTEQNRAFQSR